MRVIIILGLAFVCLGCYSPDETMPERLATDILYYYDSQSPCYAMGPVYVFNLSDNELQSVIHPWYGEGTETSLVSSLEKTAYRSFASGIEVVVVSGDDGDRSMKFSREGMLYGPDLQTVGAEFDNVAAAYSDGKPGLINVQNGEWILNPADYLSVGQPSDGRVVAWGHDRSWAIYDYQGGRIDCDVDIAINPFITQPIFVSGHIAIESEGIVWVINRNGEVVSECRGRSPGYFFDGLARMKSLDDQSSNLYGYINIEGDWVVDPIYKSVGNFIEGLAPVSCLSQILVSNDGVFSSNVFPRFDPVEDAFGDISGLEEREDRWGFIDASGDLVIPMVFDEVRHFSEGYAAVRAGELWGYIDQKGEWAIEPEFYSAHSFQEGYALVTLEEGARYVLIDTRGRIVLRVLQE